MLARDSAAGGLVFETAMPNVWPIFFDVMPEARRAVARTVAFVERAFPAPVPG